MISLWTYFYLLMFWESKEERNWSFHKSVTFKGNICWEVGTDQLVWYLRRDMKFLSLLRRVGVRPPPLHPRHCSQSSQDCVTVTLIPGDGVGPELMDSCQEVLQAMGARINFEEVFFSEVRWRWGTNFPEKNVIDKPRRQSTSGASDGFCD